MFATTRTPSDRHFQKQLVPISPGEKSRGIAIHCIERNVAKSPIPAKAASIGLVGSLRNLLREESLQGLFEGFHGQVAARAAARRRWIFPDEMLGT